MSRGVLLIILVLLAGLLTGCSGGEPNPEKEISQTLDTFASFLLTQNFSHFDSVFAPTIKVGDSIVPREQLRFIFHLIFQEITYLKYSFINIDCLFNSGKTDALVHATAHGRQRSINTGRILEGTVTETYSFRKIADRWLITGIYEDSSFLAQNEAIQGVFWALADHL